MPARPLSSYYKQQGHSSCQDSAPSSVQWARPQPPFKSAVISRERVREVLNHTGHKRCSWETTREALWDNEIPASFLEAPRMNHAS